MGYSTKYDITLVLANALSQGSPTQPGVLVPIATIGQTISDAVTDAQVNGYIKFADDQVDAAIFGLYEVPLRRVNRGTYRLAADATTGDTALTMVDSTRFTSGDLIVIRDSTNMQEVRIASPDGIPSDAQITLAAPLLYSFSDLDTTVERIRYPDPIPLISARLAAATLYDKHFAAQVTGNETDYGKLLRKMAFDDINQILSGVIRLGVPDANEYMGRRYLNAALEENIFIRADPKEFFKKE